MNFKKKYESEADGYNRRTMATVMKQLRKQLNVISTMEFREGEITVIKKKRRCK